MCIRDGLLSHRILEPAALSKALFHREGSALEVDARYRSELGEGRFVRVQLGYRSNVTEGAGAVDPEPDRQARVGGAAGIRLLDAFVVEAGGTGDYSAGSRGIAPELTLSVEALAGLTVYGFASRRFEQREPGPRPYGNAGVATMWLPDGPANPKKWRMNSVIKVATNDGRWFEGQYNLWKTGSQVDPAEIPGGR